MTPLLLSIMLMIYPYQTQLGNEWTGDCGPAVAVMIARYCGLDATLDEMVVGYENEWTTLEEIMGMMARYEISMERIWIGGQDNLKDILATYGPGVVLVERNYRVPHWLWLTHTKGRLVVYHDPLAGANQVTSIGNMWDWMSKTEYAGSILVVENSVDRQALRGCTLTNEHVP